MGKVSGTPHPKEIGTISFDFAKSLKKKRKAAGITQKQLAQMIGIRQGYYNRIELGREASVSGDVYDCLVDFLNGKTIKKMQKHCVGCGAQMPNIKRKYCSAGCAKG